MDFPFFSTPEREPSQYVGFSGNRIDRQSENRTEASLQLALADPRLRVIVMQGGRLYMRVGTPEAAGFFDTEGAHALGADFGEAILLGTSEAGPVVVAPSRVEPDALPEPFKAIDIRSVLNQGLLDTASLGAMAQAASLLAWQASCRFCGRCGAITEKRIGGYKRVCTACATEFFPRTDPVVIMLAIAGGRCLLGRSPRFAEGMYSTLAGFVEPGETIEDAVRRETLEEAGIRLGRIVYHASQPWPFPHSLMIGCFGEALNEDIAFDERELADCRWFSRDETRAILSATHPDGFRAPPATAIAHHLMKAWAERG